MVAGFYPKTVKEALELRLDRKETLLLSGGTDVCVVKRYTENIIFLNKIKELKKVEQKDSVLSIGAGAVYSDLLQEEKVPKILKKAIRSIASPAIRNAGTVGGNICNASPAGDTLPVLYALSAVIVKAFLTPEKEVKEIRLPIEEFILGVRKIALAENEIITAIEIPTLSYENMTKVTYEKVGARQAQAISKLSFVGLMKTENNRVKDIRIAFGSVSVTTVRRKEIEERIIGKTVQELQEMKETILKEYGEHIRPIDDQRSTAVYRKKVCLNLLEDFLTVQGEAIIL